MSGKTCDISGVLIREYRDSDEADWVSCRVRAFLDSSYRDDVQQYRESYENPAVRIVAICKVTGELIGLLDVEYETRSGRVCYFKGERGGVLWHLGVLPEYRRIGVADAMWNYAKNELITEGITRVETWTQDDEPANNWYLKHGFLQKHAYLNVYVRGFMDRYPLNKLFPAQPRWKFGHIRDINFEADLRYRSMLEEISYRMHEVRGYEVKLIP